MPFPRTVDRQPAAGPSGRWQRCVLRRRMGTPIAHPGDGDSAPPVAGPAL